MQKSKKGDRNTVYSVYNDRILDHKGNNNTAIRNQTVNAYFTVEAALIFPMVLVMMVAMIYAGFMLTDRCIADHCAIRSAVEMIDQKRNKEITAQKRDNELTELLSKKCFAMDKQKAEESVDGNKVIVEVSGDVTPDVFAKASIMPKDLWNIDTKITMHFSDPSLQIRKYKRMKYLIGNIVGKMEGNSNG